LDFIAVAYSSEVYSDQVFIFHIKSSGSKVGIKVTAVFSPSFVSLIIFIKLIVADLLLVVIVTLMW
jgi:hypothetical protein